MATLFVLLFLFGMFHLIYESILAPMLRLELRYKLFKIRDQLRNLKIEQKYLFKDDTFELLDESVCATIKLLPSYSIFNIFLAWRISRNDQQLKKKVRVHQELIAKSKLPAIHKIDREIVRSAAFALAFNSGGWIYIVFPLAMLLIGLAYIIPPISKFILFCKKLMYRFSYAGESAVPNINRFALN